MTEQLISQTIIPGDIRLLRDLYKRVAELAHDPVMEERRQSWLKLASLERTRPMILAELGGVLDETVPLSSLRCQEEWARDLERGLRTLIFQAEQVGDDFVIEPWINIRWDIDMGDYGVEIKETWADNAGKLASRKWDSPIKDLDRDLDKLRFRELRVNRERTLAWQVFMEEQFGDILPTRIRGSHWWTTGMTMTLLFLVGLDRLMMAMYDNPQGMHRLMAFLRDEFNHFLDWFEREGLLTLNNENDYVGSGSQGYTRELPQPDWQAGDPVRVRDLWGLSESQETVGISPAMFEEFVFQYQVPVIERFGLCYYGCCEPVHKRIEIIKRLPNLRKVSVSPWCDEEYMADALGNDYVYCRKPNPALISTPDWNEDILREDIRRTLQIRGDAPLEFAMKDVHTLSDKPWRLGRWVQLAREV
ncbi:MAG: hypothetical protein GX552_13720, partial [Chloroflexi bacterium]|nr:hypothetical protein [Chloroflexota bacterium]